MAFRGGSIEWRAHVLPPDSNPAFTADGKLTVTNQGIHDVGYAMVYELPHDLPMGTAPTIWWEGSLAASQSVAVARPPVSGDFGAVTDAGNHLRQAMVAAGIFTDEANALLDTWESSYFSVERGLKVFWIVPRAETDSILPLTLSPAPQKLTRVSVGRSEILTPEFEAELINARRAVELAESASRKNRSAKRMGTEIFMNSSGQPQGHLIWAGRPTDGNAPDMFWEMRGRQLQKP